MRKFVSAGAVLVGVSSAFIIASPAHANDITVVHTVSNGPGSADTVYRGRFTDLTDTLCSKNGSPNRSLKVVIEPVNTPNDPSFSIIDRNSNGDFTCTGNLSIPEDRLYRMTLRGTNPGEAGSNNFPQVYKSDTFYT